MRRVVHHQRVGMDALEQMRRGDVGHVEGRVLAQEHHVEAGEVGKLCGAERKMVALQVAHVHRLDARLDAPVAHGEAVGV